MTKRERLNWIIEYMRASQRHRSVDVLNSEFVDDYLAATSARFYAMPYGAHKCPQLGADLATLYRERRLARWSTGIQGMSGMGFPAWVYTYRLA